MNRAPKTHYLKCHVQPFQAVVDGSKKAELRYNDRDYQQGDSLVLQEWDPLLQRHSGRQVEAVVSHVIDVDQWRTPATPRTGMVVLSLHDARYGHFTPGE